MSIELKPKQAAELADNVYRVNENNKIELQAFFKNKLFTGYKQMLTATVGGRFLLKTQDSFGLCVMGAGAYQHDMFVIFRGTTTANNKADWVTDAACGLTRGSTGQLVHVGFEQAFKSMKPIIQSFIQKNSIRGTVHCIGHSLGGAVASLAADWIKKNMNKAVKLYTFGAPRVGTHFFARSTTNAIGEKNIYRVYHKTDPVPMVPSFPFTQAPSNSYGHFVDSSDLVFSGAAHLMGAYISSVNKANNWDALKGTPPFACNLEYGVEQWLRSKLHITTESPSFNAMAESALIFVLKKIGVGFLNGVQALAMGISTLADQLAYILEVGLNLAESVSLWVEYLIRRFMQALGMNVYKTRKELTRSLIRQVLERLIEVAKNNAKRAIRGLG